MHSRCVERRISRKIAEISLFSTATVAISVGLRTLMGIELTNGTRIFQGTILNTLKAISGRLIIF